MSDNGNRSGGLTFALTKLNGQPLTQEYAQTRGIWEPLIEATQIKLILSSPTMTSRF